ncbi:MAG: c-type cytochrome [Candidatus Binataceae bacterium]
MPRLSRFAMVSITAMLVLAACAKTRAPDTVERGRLIYVTHCIVCHNPNPNLDGEQGPAIAGSSRELVADRVLRLTYPVGYRPKRTTHNMRAMIDLTPAQIGDLTAYLHAAARPVALSLGQNLLASGKLRAVE